MSESGRSIMTNRIPLRAYTHYQLKIDRGLHQVRWALDGEKSHPLDYVVPTGDRIGFLITWTHPHMYYVTCSMLASFQAVWAFKFIDLCMKCSVYVDFTLEDTLMKPRLDFYARGQVVASVPLTIDNMV
jgi:hypothetical protein